MILKLNRKKVLGVLTMLSLAGCAIGPYGDDYREYLRKPEFVDNINGKIIVDDQTGYKKGESNFRENPKNEILNEVKRSKKNVVEDNPEVELHFTYYKCEQKELFPTQSEPLNGLIAVGTLGFWPIGSIKTCKTELVVRDVKTGKDLEAFVYIMDARRGGSFYMYMFGVRSMFMSKGSWGLPARRLLMQYQEKTKTTAKP